MQHHRIFVTFAILAAMTGLSSQSQAGTYCWTNARGDGDWTKPGNFVEGSDTSGEVATVAPGADDVVYLRGATVTLEYDTNDDAKKASCEAFAAVKQIHPTDTSVIDITVPANETLALSCAITWGTAEKYYNRGRLIKRGTGELDLTSVGKVTASGEFYDYYCAITVDEGVLKLPQSDVADHYHIGETTVNANGTLFTVATGTSKATVFYSLFGSGTVTNDVKTSRLEIVTRSVFSGRLGGRINYYSSGWITLSGTESTAPGSGSDFTVYQNFGNGVASSKSGCAEVALFGRKPVDDVNTPSSIGYAVTCLVRDSGGAFRYIGTGETTDKDLRLWPQATDHPTYLDGGPHGGLVWTGIWGHRNTTVSTYQHKMQRLVIQGSNTAECVMSGKIEVPYDRGGTNYTFYITKAGTGTWRMQHNSASQMHGAWRIKNGTLRYDTIAEKGVNSALGSSTMLYKDIGGALALDENKVDYAFWLGGGKGGNRANLEYVGETNCVSTTRRFAVDGIGGVINNGGGFLRLSDFYATNNTATLVLGGTNALDNVADNIADGADVAMSVVKEGSGTWRLGTNCTFTGSIDVTGGTLVVGNPLWNYYRWVIRATYSTTGSSGKERYVGLQSFGLFDANGNDRVYCLSHEGDWYANSSGYYCSYPYSYSKNVFASDIQSLSIDEGHFRVTKYNGTLKSFTVESDKSSLSNLFAHANCNARYFYSRTPQMPPLYGTEENWIVFTMRPVRGAPITSWDYVNEYYNQTYQMISNCVLEASVDGRLWTKLDEVTNDTKPAKGKWQSDNTTAYVVGYTTHTTGMPISPGPTNDVAFAASSVSVAAGAVLKAQNVREKPVIRRLVVDCAGGGTVDGFAFAPDTELVVVNAPSSGNIAVPMTLSNVSGLDDISGWSLSVNGKSRPSERLTASGSGFSITSPGMLLIVR